MPEMTFLGFIAIVLIGFAVFAVALKMLEFDGKAATKEDNSHAPQPRLPADVAASVLSSFERPIVHPAPLPTLAIDAQLFALVAKHIQLEQAVVNEFIRLPSVETLYREAPRRTSMN